jgi:hypothetical protein
MAKNLGDFGVAHDDMEELTFGYFGKTIRVNPQSGELVYLDFMAKAMEIDEENESEGVKITMDFLKQQIHDEDWSDFWKLAKENRQTLNDLMTLSKVIVEATAAFPTTPSPDSASTLPATNKKSKAVSSSRGNHRAIESAELPVEDAAYAALEGRPDLQRAVQQASEAAH